MGIKIHVLTGPDLISYYFYFPLLVNREKLRQSGIRIRYFKEIEENIYDCDLILLDSKYFRPLWRDRDYVFTILGRMRGKSQNLVWMDTTDSTGTTHFQVMPYVDKYWKKHLLKNRDLYELRYYGARIYTDYNHKHFHCGPPEAASVDPIQKIPGPISMNSTPSMVFVRPVGSHPGVRPYFRRFTGSPHPGQGSGHFGGGQVSAVQRIVTIPATTRATTDAMMMRR